MIAQQLFNPEKDFHTITTNCYSLDCRFPLQQPFPEQLIGTRKIDLLNLPFIAIKDNLSPPRSHMQQVFQERQGKISIHANHLITIFKFLSMLLKMRINFCLLYLKLTLQTYHNWPY